MKYKAKGKSLEVAVRRERVRELFCRGLRQHEIVTELGLPRGSGDSIVSQDLKAVREAWKAAKGLRDFDEAMARQLDKLEVLERELWRAYDRSCKDSFSESVSSRRVQVLAGDDGLTDTGSGSEPTDEKAQSQNRESVITSTGRRDGTPAFTHQLLQVIQAQNELLGLTGKDQTSSSSPPLLVFKITNVVRDGESNKSIEVKSDPVDPEEDEDQVIDSTLISTVKGITVDPDAEYDEPDDDEEDYED